jgi:hypothetical protein
MSDKLIIPLKSLYTEVNALHVENSTAAKQVAVNVVRIGVSLWQIKEAVGHGNFIDAMEKNCPNIGRSTCSKYMRLAHELAVEEQCKLLSSAVQNGGANVPVCPDISPSDAPETKCAPGAHLPAVGNITPEIKEQARRIVDEMKWSEVPFTHEQLATEINGQNIAEAYREYNIVRPPQAKKYTPPATPSAEEIVAAAKRGAQERRDALHASLGQYRAGEDNSLATKAERRDLIADLVETTKFIRATLKADKKPKALRNHGGAVASVADTVPVIASGAAKPEKPYGYCGFVTMLPDPATKLPRPHKEFHYVGSLRRARLRALGIINSVAIESIEPVTKAEWIAGYGDPSTRM